MHYSEQSEEILYFLTVQSEMQIIPLLCTPVTLQSLRSHLNYQRGLHSNNHYFTHRHKLQGQRMQIIQICQRRSHKVYPSGGEPMAPMLQSSVIIKSTKRFAIAEVYFGEKENVFNVIRKKNNQMLRWLIPTVRMNFLSRQF